MSLRNVPSNPEISGLICTYNRSHFLQKVLGSLCNQSLSKSRYEVVVVDDGSSDETRDIVMSFVDKLPLRYFYQENAGLAAAKNYAIEAANGPVVVFMDDDDLASPRLLEEHLHTHSRYPDSNYAVLGYTNLAEDLVNKPLMHFVTEVGCYLFMYPPLKDGELLDYTYFWGGRSSCKKNFLVENGNFNPVFKFGCEDIELGYRLSKYGLKVAYNANAKSTMMRELTVDDFFKRLIRQGESQYVFSTLHRDPEVQRWAQIVEAKRDWPHIEPAFNGLLASARALDKIANEKLKWGFDFDVLTRDLLYRAYWHAFNACKLNGIVRKDEVR
jgi:glycosyltransferase involved in cell wall biosynthesis